ncbi:hydrolase, alpha/beta domain protein [Oesophagostomum dentatum]|uniref:FACT complex subunit n=1 Tax=Oesophagostomum dentatum TaxID=61180 RepID=A0A0B1TGN8_OESDE|nr:hydrolase, alpha/beta domain protein [Oesophagostomum dentatum]
MAAEMEARTTSGGSWLLWTRASLVKLAEAETRLFATFGAQIISRFIPIRFKGSEIYTVTTGPTQEKKSEEPVVLVHGFGAGVAVWCANITALAKHHTVHAFDLLGFGRSSRPRFSNDPTLAELEMVESIEDWRKSMGIEKMYLVAHSFGAYLASSYALEHPHRVKHLILVDPWGFPEKVAPTEKQITPYPWMIFIGGVLSQFNPLATLRAAGPYGPSIVKKLRPDLRHRYKSENPDDIYYYLYHCNAQNPTGETAFKSMTLPYGWAKRPMIKRFNGIDNSVPVTFIYGSKSWIDPGPAFDIQAQRNGYVDIQIIRGAGHHVYADSPQSFNDVVETIVNGQEITSQSEGSYGLANVEGLMVMVGQDEGAAQYSKSKAFQIWLLNTELLDTLMLFTKKGIYVLASNRKADYFNSVKSDEFVGVVPPVTPIHRDKSDKDTANFAKLLGYIKNDANNKVGYFSKDVFDSDFCNDWQKASADVERVDVSAAFVHVFAVKDEPEIETCRTSAAATVNAWSYARKKFIEAIDQEKKVKHSRLANDIDEEIGTMKVQGQLAKNKTIETCYNPIIMSGGSYSLKWSTESSDKLLHYGVIVTSLGARLENYCTNLTRTLMVEPSKNLEDAYEGLLATQAAVIEALKPGAKLCDVYSVGVKTFREKCPDIADKLYKKDFGFVTGIEFREGALTISPKCDDEVKAGMVFIVSAGVEGLTNTKAKDDAGKNVTIALSDTVLVKSEGTNDILTERAKSRLKNSVIRFKEEEEDAKDSNKENTEELGRGKRSVVLSDQTRNKATNEDKRKEHQKLLAQQLNDAARQRLAQASGAAEAKKIKKSNVSYKSYDKFPVDTEINKLNIFVDKRHDTIILPIFGVPVPFHISMIKNCSQSVEGDFTYLRINFAHPGSQIGKETAQFPNPLATYLKELTYRASNVKEHGESIAPSTNLNTAFRLIKEIQKRFRTEEAEEREKEGAVKQDKLILSQAKANPKLKDLFVRPNIIAKRISGSLEAHINGFRYTSLRGDRIDVLYNNIKHAFFQPCDNEMIILLHFHLKHPVLWGKKKYKDIQFYTEVGEITTDLGKYHHMQDRDDVQSEQMEREMRRKLNQTFQNFCDKVVKQTNDQFDFDAPFSELGFLGVPHRSSCMLKPTSSCLVNLTEWPPFIVTLDEVELVHFERVSFQLKNFDMVFIFKDYNRKTQMVQQIPMSSLDGVKEWLNTSDLRYTEGIQSLNWPKIMKDESESEEAYTPSESESGEDESDEDESEGEATSEDSEEEGSLDSDESEGKDWSDLEEEAARADKKRDQEESGGDHKRHHDRDRDRKRQHEREMDRKRHHSSKGGPPPKRHK